VPKIILTANVKDGKTWEKAYRSHADLFRAAGIGTVQYTVDDDDHVVMCTEVDDVKAYMDFVKADSTQAAMKNDGVKRKTVKVYVLDKEFSA
jgi:hypothetical protein